MTSRGWLLIASACCALLFPVRAPLAQHWPDHTVKVVVPYGASDSALPVYSYRQLDSMVYSQNCTSVPISTAIEVFYDNVIINGPRLLNQ